MTQSPLSKRSRAVALLSNDLSPFGRQLVQAGYVDGEQMQQALAETRKSGRPLTEILESMTGRQLSPELLRQYKKQQLFELKILYGVESLDPEIDPVTQNQMGALIDTLIPIDLCRRYKLVPLMQKDSEPPSLLVAMVSPDNLEAQDELKRILRPQGISLQRMVIAMEDYQKLLERYLDEQLRKTKQAEEQKAVDVSNLSFGGELEDAPDEGDMDIGAAQDAEGAPIVNLVNKILMKALQDGVSDIHVEPQEESLRVRFRKDGVLQQAFESLPKKIAGAVSARFKIMAELDIAERRMPQDGKIRRVFQGRKVDFRVSTLPSRYGEKVVLRILDNTQTQLGLDILITDPDTLQIVRDMASRPFGLILVTGPTGSGKSTSLYSVLAERNDPGVNISTAEDPIEYSLPGITQVQVIREKGMDFASILRSFLRQDPDVILVGETRDKETAKTAIEAALTGHLVLTTLHTNDAAGAIARLDEMGVEPFMISGALLGILAQRLMRKVCTDCRIPYEPSLEELERFGLPASSLEDSAFHQANTISSDQRESLRNSGQLCQKCNGVGYKGRVGVYEVMRITERLQSLINEGASTELIKEAAVDEGMKTLLAYSLMLVRQGHTTLEEVERVTFTDSGLEAEMKAKRKSVLTCRACSAQLHQEWSECPYCMTPRFHD
ncbi:GspE/PulE family protein [Oscillatoria sp. FACHB-1406]|uniref:GspE/PulE family protein n=1 Tax=Oscillatoria sp. FACHB-1406 TaxID=2692846 RepID=UPI001683FC7E|nr:GspE/PulE family protein [Oscillatoria sp. FACHB-1406]MBD2578551.1 type II/IV secretion system protein [Oscillatoria sp. FACHB-1406]